MKQSTLKKTNLYSNGKMLAPDNELLCRVSIEKINWYLKRGLAILIDEDPPTIRLNFEPNGRGKSKDAFYLADRENKCVVCGKENEKTMTRHHIVPYCYRKYFPLTRKRHVYHDVVLLCQECHRKYEKYADKKKKKLHKKHKVPMHKNGRVIDDILLLAKKSADAILSGRYSSDDMNFLKVFFKRNKIKQEDLEIASHLNPEVKKLVRYYPGQELMKKIKDIDEFILNWRKHFIDTMEPEYLPSHWNINKKDVCHLDERKNND